MEEGELFIKHLGQFGNDRAVLQQELEMRTQEASRLTAAAAERDQRRRELEAAAEQTRLEDLAEIEAQGRQAIDAVRAEAKWQEEEVTRSIRQVEAERDNVLAHVTELEARLRRCTERSAPREHEAEAELPVVRARLRSEAEARRAAEQRIEASTARAQALEAELHR